MLKKTARATGERRPEEERRAKRKGEENISEKAQKQWQGGDVLGEVESRLI